MQVKMFKKLPIQINLYRTIWKLMELFIIRIVTGNERPSHTLHQALIY